MFRTILRRELQEIASSSILISYLVALTILVSLSAYIQAGDYRRLVEDYVVRQSIHQAENNSQSIVIIRPLPPMAPFFNGAYGSLPDEFRLRNDAATANTPSADLTPLDWIFPKIDLSFIIGVLMTLMTILLAHDIIVSDREQGTLKLILAGPVKRRTVLAAKLTGIILAAFVILVYVISLYTAVLTVFSGGTVDLSGGNLKMLAAFMLVATIVLMVTAALGVAVSAMVRRSLVSLFVCGSAWIIIILICPTFGPYIASIVRPVLPPEAFQRDMISKEKELILEELADHRKAAAELKAQHVEVEVAWRRYLELRREWIERRNEEIGRLVNERQRQIRNQRSFARRISLFSPYVAFKEILGSFCGTGLESYDEFLASVELHRQEEFIPKGLDFRSRQKPWLKTNQNDNLQLNPYQAPSPTLSQRLANVAWPLFILIAEALILMMLGFINFERHDARA